MNRTAKLFRSGGSLAVRLPKSWIGGVERVRLAKDGNAIIITPESDGLFELARRFRKEGVIDFVREKQPNAPDAKNP